MKKKKTKTILLSINDSGFRAFLMSGLRRLSRFWEPAKNVIDKARIARGMYQCSTCKKIVGHKEIKADHINPVVPVEGFTDWNGIVERMFCDESGFQALCKICHDIKTKKENEQRKRCRKEKSVLKYFKEKSQKNE
jgi:5-methylcytosine-specific restriction endonuclease McrA